MRADRLVQLMMLLQSRKRSTIGVLARELEVSERTVHRDLDALSASGVPVVVTRGASGGVSLMEGWRSQLTGFTRPELHALAAMNAPGAFDDLGLSAPLRSGLLKLAASLPALQQPVMEYARQRLHIDASGWFTQREASPQLTVLRDAVWNDRRVRLRYRDFDGRRSERQVDPYGLVVKNDQWYLVAGSRRGPSVYRGSRIEGARLLEQGFTRPERFELVAFWKGWCEEFARKRPAYPVTLRLTASAFDALRALRPPRDQALLDQAPVAGDGTRTVTVDFERESIAVSQLCLVAPGLEVLAPAPLRERLHQLARSLLAAHAATDDRPVSERAGRKGERSRHPPAPPSR